VSDEKAVIEVTEEEVDARLRAAIERAMAILRAGARAETLEGQRQRDALLAALSEDAAVPALLEGAWREGGRDKALQVARGGVLPEADVRPADPVWSDVASERELRARWREETVCETCSHASVCEVARSGLVEEHAVVVSRCLGFNDVASCT
jgi:hypothetical protein